MLASALRRRALWAPGVRLLGRREDLARVAPSRPSSSSSASEPPGPDPAARMASDLTTYARGRYRAGDRAGAAGVLEHGAEMVMRVGAGPEVDAAASRARLAWALVQAVRGARALLPAHPLPASHLPRKVARWSTVPHPSLTLPTIP